MKKFFGLSLVLMGMLFFCACEKENADLLLEDHPQTQLEDGVLKGAKKHAVPFKSQFVIWEREEVPDDEVDYRAYFDGEGNATHLGKTILFQDQSWVYGAEGATGWGTMIFTAANGDELWSTYTSSFLWEDWPVFILPGEGEFAGGTGRFVNATGTFTMDETFDVNSGTGTGIYTGTIKY